ncbi:MAG: serine/threonine protein kinase [Mariniblastus sp.]
MALEKIGPYKFEGVLGRGGMGTVYRGRHEETGEVHAIKVLAPTYAHDPHFRGRFESEIKALIKLNHTNIVRLLSYGQEDAMLFFSMELVEGNSLYQMQRRGHRFDWREILAVAQDVAKGLRHAHDRGIIHRDLKPGNLLMTTDEDGKPDFVKITDFGIAKSFGSSQNTGENVLGTMDFMSPEQAKGEPVTIRSDLYSLGTVMFTLLSGKPPFTSNSVEESLRNLTRVPAPRISSVVPNVPPQLDELIKKLMAKRPENRIQTAQALLYQIEEAEQTLRDYSEAKTAELPRVDIDNGFDLKAPRTEVGTDIQAKRQTAVTNSVPNTVEATLAESELDDGPSAAVQVDYFNTVTDQIREKHFGESYEPLEKKSTIWPVALGLLAVILLGAYGTYQAFLPPSAEELFTKIENNIARPNKVLEEIDLFLKHYPDEPRAEKVEEIRRIGEAVGLYNSLTNTLAVRRSLPGENRLTENERMFLSIVDLADDEPDVAKRKMANFVNILRNDATLSDGDKKCLEAAKSYKIKIENDALAKILANVTQIRTAMNNAAMTTETDEAILVYQSIIELYGDFSWGDIEEANEGRELVAKAKEILKSLQEEKNKPAQTPGEEHSSEEAS